MKICDLHCHSNCSDGTLTPEELIDKAMSLGIGALALTDHNTFSGLERFRKYAEEKLPVLLGCEFTTEINGKEFHLVGFFSDTKGSEEIQRSIAGQRERKEKSNHDLIDRLIAGGYDLSWEEFCADVAGIPSVNRVQIADYLLKKGIIPTAKEGFRTLLSPENGFYVEARKLDFFDMIRQIREAGGVSVLAHPLLNTGKERLEELLKQAKDCGLDGTEAYYSTYSIGDTEFMEELCDQLGLIKSGGSDFHGSHKETAEMGSGKGDLAVPFSCYETIRDLLAKRCENR